MRAVDISRRSIAEKLNEEADFWEMHFPDDAADDYCTILGRSVVDAFVVDVSGDGRPTTGAELLYHMAGLIDLPTCLIEPGGVCSACGEGGLDVDDNYCRNCGARIERTRMEFTSERRREVAAELRRQAAYGGGSLGEWWQRLQDLVCDDVDFPNPERLFDVLADLIDPPTCAMEYDERNSGDELYPTDVWVCNNCGWFHYAGKPCHCENCGRRVVDAE